MIVKFFSCAIKSQWRIDHCLCTLWYRTQTQRSCWGVISPSHSYFNYVHCPHHVFVNLRVSGYVLGTYIESLIPKKIKLFTTICVMAEPELFVLSDRVSFSSELIQWTSLFHLGSYFGLFRFSCLNGNTLLFLLKTLGKCGNS